MSRTASSKIQKHHIPILQNYVEDYRMAKPKERRKIISDANHAIKKASPTMTPLVNVSLRKNVQVWFKNFARRRGKVGRAKYGKKYHWKHVAAAKFGEDVKEMMQEMMPGITTQWSQYLACFQTHLTVLTDDLEEEEIDELKAAAKEWNESAPPEEIRRRDADETGRRCLQAFAKDMYRKLGMRLFFLSSHVSKDGSISIAKHDFNDELGNAEAFTRSFPDWETEPIFESWKNYADQEMHNGEEERSVVIPGIWKPGTGTKKQREKTELEMTEDGEPLVPDSTVDGRQREIFVRAFANHHYRIASGRNKPVPWEVVSQTPGEFMDPEYLPPGISLKDPSKLHRDDTKKILEHWKDRQDDEDVEITFMFKAFLNKEKDVVENIARRKSGQVAEAAKTGKKMTSGSQKKKGKGNPVTRPSATDDPDREETPVLGHGGNHGPDDASEPEQESEPEDDERGQNATPGVKGSTGRPLSPSGTHGDESESRIDRAEKAPPKQKPTNRGARVPDTLGEGDNPPSGGHQDGTESGNNRAKKPYPKPKPTYRGAQVPGSLGARDASPSDRQQDESEPGINRAEKPHPKPKGRLMPDTNIWMATRASKRGRGGEDDKEGRARKKPARKDIRQKEAHSDAERKPKRVLRARR